MSSNAVDQADIRDLRRVTILTASTADQYALETGEDRGCSRVCSSMRSAVPPRTSSVRSPQVAFTRTLINHLVTGLSPRLQNERKKFVSLRETDAPIELHDLQKLTRLFEDPTTQLALRSSATNRSAPVLKTHRCHRRTRQERRTSRSSRDFVKVNLVRPVDAPHMWHAALNSTACELTVLGQHYWKLVHRTHLIAIVRTPRG